MKPPVIRYGILAVLCIVTILAGTASAASGTATCCTGIPGTLHPGSDLSNVTLQQEIVARYQERGFDVSGLESAFRTGNRTAMMAWMQAHRPARTTPSRIRTHPLMSDLSNVTLQQEIVARYQQRGFDVSGLESAFRTGNRTAMMAWMQAHHPARPVRIQPASPGAGKKGGHPVAWNGHGGLWRNCSNQTA